MFIMYLRNQDHKMEKYWATWVRGTNGLTSNELLKIKSLWKSGMIFIVVG